MVPQIALSVAGVGIGFADACETAETDASFEAVWMSGEPERPPGETVHVASFGEGFADTDQDASEDPVQRCDPLAIEDADLDTGRRSIDGDMSLQNQSSAIEAGLHFAPSSEVDCERQLGASTVEAVLDNRRGAVILTPAYDHTENVVVRSHLPTATEVPLRSQAANFALGQKDFPDRLAASQDTSSKQLQALSTNQVLHTPSSVIAPWALQGKQKTAAEAPLQAMPPRGIEGAEPTLIAAAESGLVQRSVPMLGGVPVSFLSKSTDMNASLNRPLAEAFVDQADTESDPRLAPLASGGDGQAVSSASRTTASVGMSFAGYTTSTAQAVGKQIAVASLQAQNGVVEIALNPEELGRLRISLTPSDTGMLVTLISEKPETADLMRRYIDTLGAEFEALGYQDISFSFAGENQQNSSDTGPADSEVGDDLSGSHDDMYSGGTSNPVRIALGALDLKL